MKATVKKSDYEIYTFNIPLSLRGKKRNAFITRELEKNHPCFSQQCCFDSRLKLHKGKLQSMVAVMDKLKLLEYRGKSKNGISLEGIKNYKFFDDNKKFFLFALVLLILSFLAVPIVIFNNANTKKIVEHDDSQVVEEKLIQNDFTPDISVYDFLEKMFLKIVSENGFIKNLTYTKNILPLSDFGLEVSLDIEKVYPEKMDFIEPVFFEKVGTNFSTVSYKNGVPSFSVDYSLSQKSQSSSTPVDLKIVSELRSVIEQKSQILSEDFEKGIYRLSVDDKDFCDLFLAVAEKIKNLHVDVASMEITQGLGVHNVKLEFYVPEIPDEKVDVSLLADFWNLFCEQKNPEVKIYAMENSLPQKVIPKKMAKETSIPVSKNYGEKIGEVVMKNGKKLSYYKSVDGKIKGVEE